MEETKYYCDKCGKEVTKDRDTCLIVTIGFKYPDKYYSYGREKSKDFLLCYECSSKIGINKIEEKPKQDVPETVENKLYDLLCDLGVMFNQ